MSEGKTAKIGDLKPDKRNANKGTQRGLRTLDDSLRQYGAGRSILLDKNNNIIAGNKTAERAADIGLDDVIVVETDGTKLVAVKRTDLDLYEGDTARKLAYADNRVAELDLDWDVEVLTADMLGGLDLSGLFDDRALKDLGVNLGDPPGDTEPQIDKAAELQAKWGVKLGDLWQLGDHRLVCGDCTDRAVVERVMDGERAALVVTDPPYGVEYADKNSFLNSIDKGNRVQTEIENDHGKKEDTQELWKNAFHQMNEIMEPGAVVYCFMPQGGDQMMMMMMMMGAGIEPRHELIWLKNNHVLGRVDYAYKHEPILYAWKAGGHKFYGDFQTSILEFDKPTKSDLHPTMKPVALIERLISNSSQPGAIVYEPFAGSGTTLIACQNLQRKCRAVEISDKYCSVILQRFLDHTGIMPVLVG